MPQLGFTQVHYRGVAASWKSVERLFPILLERAGIPSRPDPPTGALQNSCSNDIVACVFCLLSPRRSHETRKQGGEGGQSRALVNPRG